MKWVLAVTVILLIVGAVTGIWHHNGVDARTEALDRSQKRLNLVSDQIDLHVSGGLFTPVSIKEKQRSLATERADLNKKLQERVSATRQVLDRIVDCVEKGDFGEAQEEINKAKPVFSEQDHFLIEASAYLERLNLQDFDGAKSHLGILNSQLPQELGTSQIGVLLRSFIEVEQEANRKRQAEIAQQVRSHVRSGNTERSSTFTPALRGRAMVWDFTKSGVDPAYNLLEDNLRGSSRDGIITMFCVMHRENIEVGRYTISNQPAYREEVTVGVVYWPEKTSPGTTFVSGGSPRQTRIVSASPEYGSAVEIKKWIEGLPRGAGLQAPLITAIDNAGELASVLPGGPEDEKTKHEESVRVTAPDVSARAVGRQPEGTSHWPPAPDNGNDDSDLPGSIPQPLSVQIKVFSLFPLGRSADDYRSAVEEAAASALLAHGYTVAEEGSNASALLSIGYSLAIIPRHDPDNIIGALLRDQSTNLSEWRSLKRTRTYCLGLHIYLWDTRQHSLIGYWQQITLPEAGNAVQAGAEPDRFALQQISSPVDRLFGGIKLEKGQNGHLSLRNADQNAFSQPDMSPSRRRVWIDIDRDSGSTYYRIDETFERDLYQALVQSGWDCSRSPDHADCILHVRWKRTRVPRVSSSNTHPYRLTAAITLSLKAANKRPPPPAFSETVHAETPSMTGGLSSREATMRAWRQQYRAARIWTRLLAALNRAVPPQPGKSGEAFPTSPSN